MHQGQPPSAGALSSGTLSFDQVQALSQPSADVVVAYGPETSQYGELFLPTGTGIRGVVLLIHGGCWRARFGLDHVRPLASALREQGVAVWSLEYRRLPEPGSGWPGSFEDVVGGAECLARIAGSHGVGLDRIVAVGHSAGGLLALWLAAGQGSGTISLSFSLAGVVGLAPITDLERALTSSACGEAIAEMLGSPHEHPDRYRAASPIELDAPTIPVRLVHGALDELVPSEQSEHYFERCLGQRGAGELSIVAGAGHFEPIVPRGAAWGVARGAVLELLAR